MAAPEGMILGPGLPEGTQYVRPINIQGLALPFAIPITSESLSSAVEEFLGKLPPGLRRIDVVGFEPCDCTGVPTFTHSKDGLPVTPQVFYGMEFIGDDPDTDGYVVSRRHSWNAPRGYRVDPRIDSVLLTPNYEAPEGSRFRSAA